MTKQSYFKDADGKYLFPGQTKWAECEQAHQFNCLSPTRQYDIEVSNPDIAEKIEGNALLIRAARRVSRISNSVRLNYLYLCCQCAPMVIKNSSAEVHIEPAREVILTHENWRLWDDGQIERTGKGSQYLAPVRGETVPWQITELAEEVDLELWGWRDKGELHTSEVLPFRNLLTFAYIWEREEDGHTYWRTHDGWMAAPTLTNGNPDWDAAGYVSDFILNEEDEKQLNEWLQEKP